jgi:hypothetical protein
MLIVVMLSVVIMKHCYCYTDCRYALCRNDKSHCSTAWLNSKIPSLGLSIFFTGHSAHSVPRLLIEKHLTDRHLVGTA